MIGTILQISWLSLKRDRLGLILTFVMPVLFFSVFATVFETMDEAGISPITTVFVDEDAEGVMGQRLRDLLNRNSMLKVLAPGMPLSQQDAQEIIRSGQATVAVVIPEGFGNPEQYSETDQAPIELLADMSNGMAVQIVHSILQAGALQLTIEDRFGVEMPSPENGQDQSDPLSTLPERNPASTGPFVVRIRDVLGSQDKKPSTAFFAAGIGVMFLLFSVSGRSAVLIEERENGVLTRMLASQLSMTQLLLGRWLFLTVLGMTQVTLMFVWGALVFGLHLWTPQHLAGFTVMTMATAAAAAAFGLVLSTACKTRTQLNGVSVVVILMMSAVGGSMFPRFMMPEYLQDLGLLTFNAWALDGYQKVFWYEASVPELWPQLAVLSVLAVGFFATARSLAVRWERG